MNELQDKKTGLQLLSALTNDNTKAVFAKSFESHLTELVLQILSPGMPDDRILALRHEAMGVMNVLDNMGVQMAMASEAAIRRATQKRVLQAVGEDDLG